MSRVVRDGRVIELAGDAAAEFEAARSPDLPTLQAQLKDAVRGRYESELEAGIPWAGKVVQIRERDHPNLLGGSAMALVVALDGQLSTDIAALLGVSPSWTPINWRMKDDSFHAIETPAEMLAMSIAGLLRFIALRQAMWTHIDAIDLLETAAAAEAYDALTGWPE